MTNMTPEELKRCLENLQSTDELPQDLEDIIVDISKTGRSPYEWELLRPLIVEKVRRCIKQSNSQYPSKEMDHSAYESSVSLLFKRINEMKSIPFTIQRLCELLTVEMGIELYKSTRRYINAILKVLSIYPNASLAYIESQPIHMDMNHMADTKRVNMNDLPVCDFDPITRAPW